MPRYKSTTNYYDLIRFTTLIRHAKKLIDHQSLVLVNNKPIELEDIEIDTINKIVNIKTK